MINTTDNLKERRRAAWEAKLLLSALPMASDVEEAIAAVRLALEIEPEPGDRLNGMFSHEPKELSAFLAHDIFNRRAQGILNRAMEAAKGLSRKAKKDLAAALKIEEPAAMATAIVKFIQDYRVKLAELLGTTQLAAFLEGAREVAAKVPEIPVYGPPIPPTLAPGRAQELIEELRGLPELERSQRLYKLPADQQAYLLNSIRLTGIRPPLPPESFRPRMVGEPGKIQFPIIDEAVKELSNKNVMDWAAFDALDDATRQKAFTVTGVDAQETLMKIRDTIAENIEQGADYQTFRNNVLESVDEGTFLGEWHLEVIFRNGVQNAFSDGQMKVLSHPFIRSGFPYATIDSIADDRRRWEHGELEKLGIQGTNVYRINDPVFQTFRGPWAWSCRCSWVALTVQMAADRGIEEAIKWIKDGIEPSPPAFVPMPSFRPPPGFQRAIVNAPLSIRLSMESLDNFGNIDAVFAIRHTPKGYTKDKPLMIGGKPYIGGEFIPGHVFAKATEDEKAKIAGEKTPKKPINKDKENESGNTQIKIKPTKNRAFAGEPVPVKNQISKQDAGKIGEDAVIAWLHSKGMKDARHMNLDRNNFPIDLIQDHACLEVKTGNVANGPGAQQWRLTIGEPGKVEKERLATMSDNDKAVWNQHKQKAIHERKAKALDNISKELGKPIKAKTITCLINPDTKTIDFYVFEGWHDRIGWKSEAAIKAYAGSVTYD